jgi:hypothetical protein
MAGGPYWGGSAKGYFPIHITGSTGQIDLDAGGGSGTIHMAHSTFELGRIGDVEAMYQGLQNTRFRIREYGAVDNVALTTNVANENLSSIIKDDGSKSAWQVGFGYGSGGAGYDGFRISRSAGAASTWTQFLGIDNSGNASVLGSTTLGNVVSLPFNSTSTNSLGIGTTGNFGSNNFELGISIPAAASHWPFGIVKNGSNIFTIDAFGNTTNYGNLNVSGTIQTNAPGTAISAPNGTAALGALSAGGIVKANTSGVLQIAGSGDLPYLPLAGGTLTGTVTLSPASGPAFTAGAGYDFLNSAPMSSTMIRIGDGASTPAISFPKVATKSFEVMGNAVIDGAVKLSSLGAGVVQADTSGNLSSVSQAVAQVLIGNGALGVTSSGSLTSSGGNLTVSGSVNSGGVSTSGQITSGFASNASVVSSGGYRSTGAFGIGGYYATSGTFQSDYSGASFYANGGGMYATQGYGAPFQRLTSQTLGNYSISSLSPHMLFAATGGSLANISSFSGGFNGQFLNLSNNGNLAVAVTFQTGSVTVPVGATYVAVWDAANSTWR